jgi:hypothetical protein
MIVDDRELRATLERIRQLQNQVAHLRQVETNPTNYYLSASGFLAEIDRMQLECHFPRAFPQGFSKPFHHPEGRPPFSAYGILSTLSKSFSA